MFDTLSAKLAGVAIIALIIVSLIAGIKIYQEKYQTATAKVGVVTTANKQLDKQLVVQTKINTINNDVTASASVAVDAMNTQAQVIHDKYLAKVAPLLHSVASEPAKASAVTQNIASATLDSLWTTYCAAGGSDTSCTTKGQ